MHRIAWKENPIKDGVSCMFLRVPSCYDLEHQSRLTRTPLLLHTQLNWPITWVKQKLVTIPSAGCVCNCIYYFIILSINAVCCLIPLKKIPCTSFKRNNPPVNRVGAMEWLLFAVDPGSLRTETPLWDAGAASVPRKLSPLWAGAAAAPHYCLCIAGCQPCP